jgi:hypothetical protein
MFLDPWVIASIISGAIVALQEYNAGTTGKSHEKREKLKFMAPKSPTGTLIQK